MWGYERQQATSCCTQESLDTLSNSIRQDLNMLTQSVLEIGFVLQQFINLGTLEQYPTPSCRHLCTAKPNMPSGYYYIGQGRIHPHRMYCDMEMSGHPFNGEPGWLKVADFDMRRAHEECPYNFNVVYHQNLTLCAKSVRGKGCQSVTYPLHGVPYQRLCGRASAFQVGTNNAFHRFQCEHCTIDDPYVDGLSITYDYPRKHIWSLAASWTGYYVDGYRAVCPCANGQGTPPPEFVGRNYFCEAGQYWPSKGAIDERDPLWDGRCGPDEEGCCGYPDQPWFCADIPGGSDRDVEVRVCSDEAEEDIYWQSLEIYVQ